MRFSANTSGDGRLCLVVCSGQLGAKFIVWNDNEHSFNAVDNWLLSS